LNHNQPADVPIQQYPTGGLFSTTPSTTTHCAVYVHAVQRGGRRLAISPDGTTLYVANYQNDSLSVINTSTRLVTNEIVFFAPGQSTAVGEMPYWPVVVSNAQGAR
jgi:YVTN family beta-propeller protein